MEVDVDHLAAIGAERLGLGGHGRVAHDDAAHLQAGQHGVKLLLGERVGTGTAVVVEAPEASRPQERLAHARLLQAGKGLQLVEGTPELLEVGGGVGVQALVHHGAEQEVVAHEVAQLALHRQLPVEYRLPAVEGRLSSLDEPVQELHHHLELLAA